MQTIECLYCKTVVEAHRKTKKFCSTKCSQRHSRGWPKSRSCRHCGAGFLVMERADANRQHCSKACAKAHATKSVRGWQAEHPASVREYSRKWRERNPDYFATKRQQERLEMIDALGGKCVVCGVDNPTWLHMDYIAGSRGLQYRHPRHTRFVMENLSAFRLLCANHHYELTLTGRIAGTDITQ